MPFASIFTAGPALAVPVASAPCGDGAAAAAVLVGAWRNCG